MRDIDAPGYPRVRRGPSPSVIAMRALLWEGEKQRSAANIEQWRSENREAFKSWDTTYGHLVQIGCDRFYVGRCQTCQRIMTVHRDVSHYKHGFTHVGRWPKTCAECRAKRVRAHDDKARGRMRRLRERERNQKRAAARSSEFFLDEERAGFSIVPEALLSSRVGSLAGQSLGIRCLTCGDWIRIRLDITFPRPIPGKGDTPK